MNHKSIAKIIKKNNKIVFFHHIKPDGDSLSSSYGLLKALQLKYPKKEIKWVADKKYIVKRFPYLNIDFRDVITKKEIDSSWVGIIGDNAIKERIYKYEIYNKTGIKICFDHHKNDINFDANVYWQDSTLGASSVQSYCIAKHLGIKYNSRTAILALFGILTDTGFFKYSLADPRPMQAASELLEFIDSNELGEIYKAMNKKTQKDLDIQGFALSNYELKKGVAYCKWTKEDQKKLKISADDCMRVNLIANIESSGAWIFFVEDEIENKIRVEFRSLGLPVNEIANKFGGGGHQKASGTKIDIDWEKADQIIKETQKELKLYNRK